MPALFRLIDWNRIKKNISHFTLELMICALGDPIVGNLTHTARLIECQRLTHVVSLDIPLISYVYWTVHHLDS